MSSIIAWLEEIEREAARLYGAAAQYFEGEFARFLGKLAEEERWHHHLIRSASLEAGGQAPAVSLDEPTRRNIAAVFDRTRSELEAGTLTREAMLEAIVAVEFSEWNEFFVYTLHQGMGEASGHLTAALEIDRHKHDIVEYFGTIPDGKRYLETVRALPAMADKRILVIEPHDPLAQLLRNILNSVGEVTVAANGLEGLSLLEDQRFDVVLSDVDMAAIEVEDFFEGVLRIAPQMRDRLVFFSGLSPQEEREIFGDEEVTLLVKPSMISQIRRTVTDIAHRGKIVH